MSDKLEATAKGLSGCAGAGCMIYLIGFVALILFIVAMAFLMTPNPYG
jgi:hypothetical protein